MTAHDFVKLIVADNKPVVIFNDRIEIDFETGFDTGMKAKAVNYIDDGNGCYRVYFDFSEFEDRNKELEKPNWYDKQSNPTLKWSETNFYPVNKIESIFFDYDMEILCFELVDSKKSKAYQDYIDSKSTLLYVEWLEDQYLKNL